MTIGFFFFVLYLFLFIMLVYSVLFVAEWTLNSVASWNSSALGWMNEIAAIVGNFRTKWFLLYLLLFLLCMFLSRCNYCYRSFNRISYSPHAATGHSPLQRLLKYVMFAPTGCFAATHMWLFGSISNTWFECHANSNTIYNDVYYMLCIQVYNIHSRWNIANICNGHFIRHPTDI